MKRRESLAQGFTLVEMLVVLGIMTTLAAIAIPVFLSSRATTRQTGAENAVRAGLASAREAAIRLRHNVAVEFVSAPDPQRGDFLMVVDKGPDPDNDPNTDFDRRIGAHIPLPDFIKFDIDLNDPTCIAPGMLDDWLDRYDTVPLLAGTTPPYPNVTYRADGSACEAAQDHGMQITLRDVTEKNHAGRDLRQVLRVLPATGIVVEAEHLEDPGALEGPGNVSGEGWL